jgi:hypothetical protein
LESIISRQTKSDQSLMLKKARMDFGDLNEAYRYTKLPPSGWIRLLRLLPGKFEDDISCELVPIELEKAPPYEPISYCWGDATQQRTISCDGFSLSITRSLLQALRRFRREEQSRMLWADGICINQLSVREREQQVAFMDQVYRRGECTLIWLGERPKDVDIAGGIRLMKDFNRHMQAELDAMDKTDHKDIFDAIFRIPALPNNHGLVRCEEQWVGIRFLLSCDYFRRLWVQVELALSSNAVAYCGRHEVRFLEFALFEVYFSHMRKFLIEQEIKGGYIIAALSGIWSTFDSPKSWMNDGGTLERVKDLCRRPQDTSLLQVLDCARMFEASLSRDHIFALLGHPYARCAGDDRNATIIDVDYTRSVEETSVILAEALCTTRLSGSAPPLELLCFVDHMDDTAIEGSPSLAVPSWVPVWHEPAIDSRLAPNLSFDASLWKQSWSREHVIVVPQGQRWQDKQLRVAAILLESVIRHSDPLTEGSEGVAAFVQKGWEIYSKYTSSPPSSPRYWWVFVYNFVHTYDCLEFLFPDFVAFCRDSVPDLFRLFVSFISADPFFSGALRPSANTSPRRFEQNVRDSCINRKYFATDGGMCGIGLCPTQVEDVLVIYFWMSNACLAKTDT